MRLIDADALLKSMFSYYACVNENTCKRNYNGETIMTYEVAELIEDCIENAPTIDAVPVVRGEWIEKTYIHEYVNEEMEERQYVVCGICGKQPPSGFGAVNFCHNCGADMRRESEVKV